MRSDYDDAGVPMLTVTHGRRATRNHILGYTVVLAIVSVATGLTSLGGPVYWLAAVVLNSWLAVGAVRIWKRDEDMAEADNFLVERKFFKATLWYLFIAFNAFMADAALNWFEVL